MTLGINVGLLVCTLLLFILVLSLCARHFADRDVRIFSEVAKKYGGKISIESFNSSATMTFPYRGAEINFSKRKVFGGKATRCCFRCDVGHSSPLSMHIAMGISGNTSISELRSLLLSPRLSLGSERFNKEFVVHGNNESFLGALLTPEFEKQLLSLSERDPVIYMHPKKDAIARLKGDQERNHVLEYSVSQAPRRREELEKLIDDALAVVRRFLGVNAARS